MTWHACREDDKPNEQLEVGAPDIVEEDVDFEVKEEVKEECDPFGDHSDLVELVDVKQEETEGNMTADSVKDEVVDDDQDLPGATTRKELPEPPIHHSSSQHADPAKAIRVARMMR